MGSYRPGQLTVRLCPSATSVKLTLAPPCSVHHGGRAVLTRHLSRSRARGRLCGSRCHLPARSPDRGCARVQSETPPAARRGDGKGVKVTGA